MAEVEDVQQASPEVEAQVDVNGAAADQDPEARYRYDDSLLIRVKGKVRRPQKPDEQERNLAVEKITAEIDKLSARIKEIKEQVEASRSARSDRSSGNQEIVRRVQALRQEFQTVLRQKQHIREELQQTMKQRDELRAVSKQLRDKLPKGVTPDAIDSKIAELEYKMAHEGGQDDKALFRRISDLNAARPAAREYAEVDAKLKACEAARGEIQHRLQQCDAVLTDVKAREDAERAILDQARSKQSENDLDIPALNVEKKECYDIIQALRAKRDEIRKQFQERYTEYVKLDKNYNNYIRSVKREEYLQRQKARAEREAEENGVEGEAAATGSAPAKDAVVVEAYASEVLTLDQLLTHLRKLAPSDEKTVAQEEKKEVEVPKGMKLLKKDDDAGFMPITKKKGKGGKAAEPAPAAPKAAEPAKKKLNHTLDALKTFMQFNIEVPQTTADLPTAIEKTVAKKEYYLELRRTGKKHVPPAPAPAASTSAAAESAAEPAADDKTPAEAAATSSAPAAEAATGNGTHEAAASSEAAADAAAPSQGLGVSLDVDQVTQNVSLKLRVSE